MAMDGREELSKAEVETLNDYIQYVDNSIVSKTLIDKKSGTLTLFAFDKGEGLSEHRAPFDALVQILDGQAQVTIAGKPLDVSAGQIVLMPANISHAIKAREKFKMMLVMIRS